VKKSWTIFAMATALAPAAVHAQATDPAANRTQRAEERQRQDQDDSRPASDWRLFVSSGAFFTTGDYGTETRTNSLSVPLSARLRSGPLRLSATLPYLRIAGSRSIIGGGDEGPIVDDRAPQTEREVRQGLGDLSLRARYRVAPASWDGIELDLISRVKLPTGSRRKGLSTGELDYSAGGELSYTGGRVVPFAEVQYRINGDPPGRDFRNSIASSVGASLPAGRGLATVSYDYSGSRIRGRAGAHSLNGGLSFPIARRLNLGGFGSVGLSRRAEDFSIGSVLTARVF